MTHPRRITLEIARSDPRQTSSFDVPVPTPASRVLDALLYVREHLDPSLGFRYACRAGMCGACAVVVNGKEALACQTSVASLGTPTVRIDPLRALPVLRDLTCDMAPFFAALKRADAALRPDEPQRTTPRTLPPGEPRRATIERHNGCLTCGACHSATQSGAGEPGDVGPAALNRVLMLALDERDAAGARRVAFVAGRSRELARHARYAGDDVCPAGIPLRAAAAMLTGMVAGGDRE